MTRLRHAFHGLRPGLAAALLLLAPGAAAAHAASGPAAGLASGLAHPLLGLDHIVAMVAVGIWGGMLGRPATWILPLVFPVVMALGGAMGVAGVPLPAVETGIALSGLVMGLLVAFAVGAPLWVASLVVGAFAVFHGHAHGAELPAGASPLVFGAGFVLTTALLHAVGIALGLLNRSRGGKVAVRGVGGAIAAAGAAALAGLA